jgi:phosphoglycolate phosphatase
MIASKLVIFDVDGTLFQTQGVTVPAVQQAFAAYGLPYPSSELICSFFGLPAEYYESWLAEQCSPDLAEDLVEYTNALELRLIVEKGKLYLGALETLYSLKDRGYALAICSNGPEKYVETFVNAHCPGGLFSAVYARGTSYADKTEMVGDLLKSVGPDRFAFIGDRRDDIEAAHKHNGFGIAAVYGFGNPDEWCDADACIRSIREAPDCVHRLIGL